MRPLGVIALGIAELLGATGCTFSDGEPYGLVSATLDARYELRDDRDVGDGSWQKLVSEMEIRLDEARLAVDVVELVDPGTEIGGLTFDPANPPPGYSLCHNGHCHSDSGDLVDYEDIQADLAGAEATSSTALALQGGTDDLLDASPLALECGDCQLGRGQISLVRLTARRLTVRGAIRDGLAEPRFDGERAFEGEISLLAASDEDATSGVLERAVSLPLDDDSPSQIDLTLASNASAALFDGLDPAAFEPGGAEPVALDDEPTIRAAFSELELEVTVRRDDL